MITILEQPNELSLSKNPVIYKMQTDNYITTAEVIAQSIFSIGDPSAGDTLLISWGEEEIEFTFALALDDSGKTLRTNAAPVSVATYFQTIVVPDLISNNLLFDNFNIQYALVSGSPKILLTARQAGALYNLTITHVGLPSLTITQTVGVDKVVRENFKVFCDVYITSSIFYPTLFNKIISLDADPDTSNNVVFDLSSHLNKHVSSLNFFKNTFGFNGKIETDSLRFYIRYGESYGSPKQDYYTRHTQAANTFICKGGVDWIKNPGHSFYTDVVTDNKTILTTQPLQKYVSMQTPVWIYYFNNSVEVVHLKFTYYYSDGTTSVNTDHASYEWQYLINIASFTVDYLTSLEDYDITKTLVKFDVFIETDAEDAISQTLTYILDYTNYQYERFFFYENSLGGFDVLRCTGPLTRAVDFKYDQAQKMLPYNYNPESDQEEITYNSTKKTSNKISSGFHKRDYINSLEDFFLSNNRYILFDSKHIPVTVLAKNEELPGDDSTTYAIEFEYEHAYIDQSFTPR